MHMQQGFQASRWLFGLLNALFTLLVILSSIWLGLALWIQQPLGSIFTPILIAFWMAFACVVLGIYFHTPLISRRSDILLYLGAFALALLWYFNLQPKQNRDWNTEVARTLHYERQGDVIHLHNVRNFNWRTEQDYDEVWQSRKIDLNHIQGVNILTSYWMGPQIAHTLVSFDIKDQSPLTFSIEIRKEKNESFSAIGGFFRKFELSLVASEEKDIVYTRSNIRGEQVYFFPINMQPDMAKQLFLAYLDKVDQLAVQAKWYNTLSSNCTTLVFDMVQAVTQQALPSDYRLLASGYLPNYLYDLNALDPKWDMTTWYQKAHVNPKVKTRIFLNNHDYSKQIRQDLPIPNAQPQ